MKRFTRGLLAFVLIVSMLVTGAVVSGLAAGALAIQQDVYITFGGTDKKNTWITLNDSGVIQDSALEVEIKNKNGNEPIKLLSITSTGTLTYDPLWQANKEVAGGSSAVYKIHGSADKEEVLTVTVSYVVKGKPANTAETCTAYLYATAKSRTTTLTGRAYVAPATGYYQTDNNLSISPVTNGSVDVYKYTIEHFITWIIPNHQEDCENPTINANLYVDGSRKKEFTDVGLKLNWKEKGVRKHGILDQITLTQTSDTGSMSIKGAVETSKSKKTDTSTYDKDSQSGFSVDVEENQSEDIEILGTIPTETSAQTYTMEFRGYGQTGGILLGYGSSSSAYCTPKVVLTVYNVNKSDLGLEKELNDIAQKGLNKESFTEATWNAFYAKLINAYKAWANPTILWDDVTTAKNELHTAYNNLVRRCVVYTNHYFYVGDYNQNPVLIDDQSVVKMSLENGSSYEVKALPQSTYTITLYDEYGFPYEENVTFNRQSHETGNITVNADESTNYTQEVDRYYWFVDLTELENEITRQETRWHVDEDNHPMYTDESWNAYEQAAENGRNARTDYSLFQVHIDALTDALKEAADALEPNPFNTDWLDDGVEWATAIVNNNYETDYSAYYKWDSTKLFSSSHARSLFVNLQSALNNANQVIESDNFTEAQANRAAAQLWEAIYALHVKDDRGLLLVEKVHHASPDDYGWFVELLSEENHEEKKAGLSYLVKDILDSEDGNYKLNKSDFTSESWYNLMYYIYGVYNKNNFNDEFFTAENFDAAKFYALQEGRQTPEPYLVIEPDEDYEGEEEPVGLELSVPAYSMLHNIWFLASQDDYNACRDNLIEQVKNLQWVVDATELQATLATANALYADKDLYTNKTISQLENYINYAENMIKALNKPQLYGDENAITADKVDEADAALAEAINALVLKPVIEVIEEDVQLEENAETKVVTGETADKTAGEILADFNTDLPAGVSLKIYDKFGVEVALHANVATGFKLILENNETGDNYEKFDERVFIIPGDVDGVAGIGNDDFSTVFDFAFTGAGLDESILRAAGDVNGDGKVDLSDAIMIEMMQAKA